MTDQDDFGKLPPLVPDRDDVDSHLSNRRAQQREIVRPTQQGRAKTGSSWPVWILLMLLTGAAAGGGYAGWTFYERYQTDLRRANLRISDLETRLNIVDASAEESDNTLMENIEKTIEQYDLLWANWRNNNRQFDEIQSEIARLKMVNEGQDEATANNAQQLAGNNETLTANTARVGSVERELASLGRSVANLDDSMAELQGMRGDLQSVRQALSSGDGSPLGLVGRLEYLEESMESVNAHRLQINQSLFRLQENVEALQRALLNQGN